MSGAFSQYEPPAGRCNRLAAGPANICRRPRPAGVGPGHAGSTARSRGVAAGQPRSSQPGRAALPGEVAEGLTGQVMGVAQDISRELGWSERVGQRRPRKLKA